MYSRILLMKQASFLIWTIYHFCTNLLFIIFCYRFHVFRIRISIGTLYFCLEILIGCGLSLLLLLVRLKCLCVLARRNFWNLCSLILGILGFCSIPYWLTFRSIIWLPRGHRTVSVLLLLLAILLINSTGNSTYFSWSWVRVLLMLSSCQEVKQTW